MLIRNAEIGGVAHQDVRIANGRIVTVGAALPSNPNEPVHDAAGGALLPGLHDHHLHLFALAAQAVSVACGPPDVTTEAALVETLRNAPPSDDSWLRGVGYHESVAGPLDRARLDAWLPDRPARIQHRSGSLWILNSAALDRVCAGTAPPTGAERDARGHLDGRLFRLDAWLQERLAASPPTLEAVGRRLARCGVTGVTDASATNDAARSAELARRQDTGEFPQRLRIMGDDSVEGFGSERCAPGERKILLDEARLPPFEAFVATARRAHERDRAVAVHCVTRTELVFCIAGLQEAGSHPGDRIEHAAVAPPEVVDAVAAAGLRVVTQPHFLAERGEQYRVDVPAKDQPWLYRAAGWHAAGVPLAAGSDAPFGGPDPWRSMRAAVERRSASGSVFDASEALSPEAALALFMTPLDAPGGEARRIEVDAPADLCLLDRPWRAARERLSTDDVAATWCAGRRVHPAP
ncbi:MAG: amidohydrolase family protein [Myxococcota bacterium]